MQVQTLFWASLDVWYCHVWEYPSMHKGNTNLEHPYNYTGTSLYRAPISGTIQTVCLARLGFINNVFGIKGRSHTMNHSLNHQTHKVSNRCRTKYGKPQPFRIQMTAIEEVTIHLFSTTPGPCPSLWPVWGLLVRNVPMISAFQGIYHNSFNFIGILSKYRCLIYLADRDADESASVPTKKRFC